MVTHWCRGKKKNNAGKTLKQETFKGGQKSQSQGVQRRETHNKTIT